MNREQGRAIVLAAIMVISVGAMSVAFAGGGAASDVDRGDVPGGDVEQGNTTEVFDFTLTSEDQVLEADPGDIGNDGDVEPGDNLAPVDPQNYSYVDDNGNQKYEADETLIEDGQGIASGDNDEFDDQSEVIRYEEGAFRPYLFRNNTFFTDVENAPGNSDRGNYTGEDFDDDDSDPANISREAILRNPADDNDQQIDGETEPITTGQANLTNFASSSTSLSIRDADGTSNGVDFSNDPGDFLYVNGDDNVDYDQTDDTVVVGDEPGGNISSNTREVSGTDLESQLFFLDFDQDGTYDANTDGPGGEPVVLVGPNADETGDALPNGADILPPGEGIDNNYYEQAAPRFDNFEEGSDSTDNDGTVKHRGLQNLNDRGEDPNNTLFLDDEGPDADYAGEDGEDEDVVEDDLRASNLLVDGDLDNFKGEDIGPDANDNGNFQQDDDAVIRGQGTNLGGEDDAGLDLFEEDNPGDTDSFTELVLVNEVADCADEGSDAYQPGPDGPNSNDNNCDDTAEDSNVKYGDALVNLTVANTGSASHNGDFSGAVLYRDDDGTPGPSEGDSLVEGTTFEQNDLVAFSPGQFLFDDVNQSYGNGTTGDSARFYVTTKVQDNADEGDTIQFAIPQFRDDQEEQTFDEQDEPGEGDSDESDTGLFLESHESYSTGPITDLDGDIQRPDDYFPPASDYDDDTDAEGPAPIVADSSQTIVAADETEPEPGEIRAPSSQSFGSVDVDNTETRAISVLNDGGSDVTVDSTSISGADAGDFVITSGGAPFSLAPGESKEVTVEFRPDTEGDKSASLDVGTQNANSVSVALSGTGETDSGNEDPPDKNTLTIEGTGPETDYKISVTDDLEKSDASSINTNDNINRGYAANGEVGSGSDSYTFNGSLETIKVDVDDANVYVNGNELTNEEINNKPDRVIEFQGTGPRANYDFATNGDEAIQKTTANNANINGNDDTYRTTGYGVTGDYRDAFGFDGSLQTIDAPDSVEVYVQGKLANQDAFRDNVITIVGTGSAAQYDMTVESDLLKSTANYANLNANDDVSGDSAMGEVGTASDSFIYNGDISEFSVDGDVTVFVDGERVNQGNVASEE